MQSVLDTTTRPGPALGAPRRYQVAVEDLCKDMFVADLDRPWLDTPFLLQGFLVDSQVELDTLKERHLRLRVPASAAAQLVGRVPGEISRRALPDGALSLVILRDADAAWPALATAPEVRADVLSLEDLFVEVAE